MRPADAKQLRFGLPDYSCAIKALARQMRRLASGDHSGNILAAPRRRNLKKIAGNAGSQKVRCPFCDLVISPTLCSR
jgi:hypothetical protein